MKAILSIILLLGLTGCVSYPYTMVEDGQGMYYENPADAWGGGDSVVFTDALYYPYWSIDYFISALDTLIPGMAIITAPIFIPTISPFSTRRCTGDPGMGMAITRRGTILTGTTVTGITRLPLIQLIGGLPTARVKWVLLVMHPVAAVPNRRSITNRVSAGHLMVRRVSPVPAV